MDHEPRERNGLLCIHRCVELVSKAPSVFLLKQEKKHPCFKIRSYLSTRSYLVTTVFTVCCDPAFRGNKMKQRDKHTETMTGGRFDYIYIYTHTHMYRVIHKSLRDFRSLRYSSRDGHAEGEHVNRGRDTPSFCSTLQVLDMSTLAPSQLTQFWQIPRHRTLSYSLYAPCFVTTVLLAAKPASTPRRLLHKNLERFCTY